MALLYYWRREDKIRGERMRWFGMHSKHLWTLLAIMQTDFVGDGYSDEWRCISAAWLGHHHYA